MMSKTHLTNGKTDGGSQERECAQLKNVKLKDRIHLFENLSSQSTTSNNKNTSSNNSEEVFFGHYPKVITQEQKRWTQIENGPPESKLLPWLQSNNEIWPKKTGGQTGVSSHAKDTDKNRSKTLGPRSTEKPPSGKPPLPSKPALSPSITSEGQVNCTDSKECGNTVLTNNQRTDSDIVQTESDIIYIDGTPVKLRNGRKFSSGSTETPVRSSVIKMISSFENKEESTRTEHKPRKHNATLDAIPVNSVQRRSAELRRLSQTQDTGAAEKEPETTTRKLVRRRSKSVSDIKEVEVGSQQPQKPKRTYEHDIYMESKQLIAEQDKSKNSLQNPLYESSKTCNDLRASFGDDVFSNVPASSAITPKQQGRHKKLPPVPNMPPYIPPLGHSRGQGSGGQSLLDNPDGAQSSKVQCPPAVPPRVKWLVNELSSRPRCETSPENSPNWRNRNLRRSFSSEDVSKLLSGSVSSRPLLLVPHRQGALEYAEPVSPRNENQDDPGKRDTVIDADGYSIPGSQFWKKPEPPGEFVKPSGFSGRVQSLKFARLTHPNTTWHSVSVFEPGKRLASIPAMDNEDVFDEEDELTRGRKASTEKKPIAEHTYTEPGTLNDDIISGPSVRQRSRLMTMRRKINDAFRRSHRNRAETQQKSYKDDDSSSVTSEDSAGEVNEAVMQKRLTHARAVKKRSSVYCNANKYRRIVENSKLYEYLVVISLQYNEETRRYQPIEKSRYPEELSASQDEKLRAIPHFCFPDAFKWAAVEKYESESYSFVLTSMDGSRLYGYNRRLLPPGDKPRLPEVYCIITPISCRLLFTQLLDEIEKRRMISRAESEKLIRDAYTREVPPPGGSTTIMKMASDGPKTSIMKPLVLQRPHDARLEHVDFDCLFNTLKIKQVIQIFASLLLERRVIMCSGKLSKLSKCSQAVAALLYPFAWQHVYVPVLPEKLIDMSCSPTPYIMGMLSLCIPRLEELPIDEVLIVDIDSKDFYTVVGDEETIIPKKLGLALESALTEICSYSMLDGSEADEELSSDDHEAKNRAISEVFIRFFVETCGHYMNHFTSQYDGILKFDRQGFIRVVQSRSIRRFLEVFTETQMFSLFIQEKEGEVEGIAQGLFETRVREWEAQCKLNAAKFGARVKKIGRVVKDISREGGKKVADTAKDVKTRVKANLDSKI